MARLSLIRFALARLVQARIRLLIALGLAIALVAALPAALPGAGAVGAIARALVGWNVFVYAYLALVWTMMARADPRRAQRTAALMDDTAAVVLVLCTLGAIMSLLAIVAELATAKDLGAAARAFHYGLTGATVLGSWALVPTAFGLHYAYMFFRDPGKPQLGFPDGEAMPSYGDFMYFSYTIAVASQTADVSIRSRPIRRLVLVQSVLSFFFNTSVVAMSVNVAASLAFPS